MNVKEVQQQELLLQVTLVLSELAKKVMSYCMPKIEHSIACRGHIRIPVR